MDAKHIVKHHLLIPAAVVGVLLLVGAPLNVAVVAGMMTGCLSMVFMMGSSSDDHAHTDDRSASDAERVHRSEG